MGKYKIMVGDDTRATFEADFRQASSPIFLDGNSTPFQVADARHNTSEAAELLIGWCDSQGGEIVGDDEEYEVVPVDQDLLDMVAVLERHGYRFTGNNVEDEAGDWIDHGFGADAADGWCEIGVWNASTAAEFRDAGLSPDQVARAAEFLIEESEDPAEDYTDGDPIYAACNNDLDAEVLIKAAKSAQ